MKTRLHSTFRTNINFADILEGDLKSLVLSAAKALFLAHGYEAVGMRQIAQAVGRQPVQIYRLKLSKSDILAELILDLNQQQIEQLPALRARVRGETLIEKVSSYFYELYALDIAHLPIRSVGAAHGWLWSKAYESKIIGQVFQLLDPIVSWIGAAGLAQIEARSYGLWSVYYVGFRRAAIGGGSAEDCIREIRPTLEVLLFPAADAVLPSPFKEA